MSQLTNYIQKEIEKGFSKNVITEKLMQAGYTKDEIAESFKSLKSAEPLVQRKITDTLREDAKMLRSKWLFPMIGILVLIVLVYLVFQYTEIPTLNNKCDALEGYDKDICYLKAAAEEDGSCDSIDGAFYKTLCKQKLWETHECDYKLFIGEDKEQCLWEKAIETQDPRYCNKKIKGDIECLFELAKSTNNPEMCDHQIICYEQYAVYTQDPTVCELITISETQKKYCYMYYDESINNQI